MLQPGAAGALFVRVHSESGDSRRLAFCRIFFIVLLVLADGGGPTQALRCGWNAAQLGVPLPFWRACSQRPDSMFLCVRQGRRHGHCPRDACKRLKVCNQIICLLQRISHPAREIVSHLPPALSFSFFCAHKRSAHTISRPSASSFETTRAHSGLLLMTLEDFSFHKQSSLCIARSLVIAQDVGSSDTSSQ